MNSILIALHLVLPSLFYNIHNFFPCYHMVLSETWTVIASPRRPCTILDLTSYKDHFHSTIYNVLNTLILNWRECHKLNCWCQFDKYLPTTACFQLYLNHSLTTFPITGHHNSYPSLYELLSSSPRL
jgi:hypothetical protein